ncbi:MAG: hypothetical protein K6G11_03965, partial [Lachnospiraceae bacterium]|nr:hypothetical protein [Lachnospiraceae bacterium]
ANSYGVKLDLGGDNFEKRIEIDADEKEVVLYESEVEKTVIIEIVKFSEPEYAACGIKEIEIDADELMEKPGVKAHRIEIIGDSITCGYGTEGRGEEWIHKTVTENPYKSYSMTTARYFDADFTIVAWNGKGLLTGYIGEDTEPVKDQSWLLSMLYEYNDAGLERDYFNALKEDWEKWDFSKSDPELVLINLGTNDCSYTRGVVSRNREYTDVYVDFLKTVHSKFPNAKILCMLGMMDDRLNAAVEEAVVEFKKYLSEGGSLNRATAGSTNAGQGGIEINPDEVAMGQADDIVRYLELPMQKEEDGYGVNFHPTPASHLKAAKVVVKEISDFMGW